MARRRLPINSVFLDSSVLFTAVNSPAGGSSKLFTLKNIKLVSSVVVLAEVERNVRKKLQSYHLERFFLLVSKIDITSQIPNDRLVTQAQKVIAKKDALILAEAKQAKTHFLVTLDRKHFLIKSVAKFLKPQKVLTPKMFFKILKD